MKIEMIYKTTDKDMADAFAKFNDTISYTNDGTTYTVVYRRFAN